MELSTRNFKNQQTQFWENQESERKLSPYFNEIALCIALRKRQQFEKCLGYMEGRFISLACTRGTGIFGKLLQEQRHWWKPFPSPSPQPRYMDICGNECKLFPPSFLTVPCPPVFLWIYPLQPTVLTMSFPRQLQVPSQSTHAQNLLAPHTPCLPYNTPLAEFIQTGVTSLAVCEQPQQGLAPPQVTLFPMRGEMTIEP